MSKLAKNRPSMQRNLNLLRFAFSGEDLNNYVIEAVEEFGVQAPIPFSITVIRSSELTVGSESGDSESE